MIQSFPELMALLQIPNPPEMWTHKWKWAQSKYNDVRQLHFLSHDYLMEVNDYFNLTREQSDALFHAIELVRGRRDLTTLAWLWKCLLFEENQPEPHDLASWPVPESTMGPSARMFPLIIVISNLPWLIKQYKKRGIPKVILHDTLSDIRIVMEDSKNRTGAWGIENFLLSWLLNHFQGRLFHIGRLQYIPKRIDWSIVVYRHSESGQVVTLARDESWTEHADYVEGVPITRQGKVLAERVKLIFTEWEATLQQGDYVLDVHIPRGDKLDYKQLWESYRSAREILPKRFPEHQFKGFICHTWILDPLLREILPVASNLVRFQSDYHLVRIVDDDAIYETVFVKKPENLLDLPEETSLQRAIKKHALSGKQMQSGAGFLLFEGNEAE